MKVIMTGGGTGGHIYPAVAIAEKIRENIPSAEILFIGTKRGKESELVPAAGFDIKFINVHGIDRKNMIRNIKVLMEYSSAKKDAGRIIEAFGPDAVIGTGGYVSAPVVKAAAAIGIPCYIHEQNAIPGLTNKMMEKYVKKVFLAFPEAGKGLKEPEKHVVTGNPVRREFFETDRAKARKELGISSEDFVILAFGGSQGAGRINRAMIRITKEYSGQDGTQVFFGTGGYYYVPVMNELAEKKIEIGENIHIMNYINDMCRYISAADLVISRSGALTVSEIAVCGTPSILIPSPVVTGDHQTFNAKVLADREGAVLIDEKDLTDEMLLTAVEDLRKDRARLEAMSKNSRKCAPLDAADIIYHDIFRRDGNGNQ